MLHGILIKLTGVAISGLFMFSALPATSTYKLNDYSFGSGGGTQSTSNYSVEGITGEASANPTSTAAYSVKSGLLETQQSNVPQVTISNPSSYYDKLKFVIDEQGNPSDTKYALQISTTSNFSSGVNYVKSDNTIGPTLLIADYQTYSVWGGAGGANIIGLASNTTYYLRVKASHFNTATNKVTTESAYGPSTNALTVGQQISFCLYSNANCGAGGSSEAFGSLLPSSVTDSPTNIGIDFATNANGGGKVYLYSSNGGLSSAQASYTITSASGDLSSLNEGFGAKGVSVSQTSGGPFTIVSPYNGASNNVGVISTTINSIFSSLNPIVGGQAAVQLKIKTSPTTPTGSDYQDNITFIAAAGF